MSLKIKEIPETERPYEKLELYGEKALSNAELLAIIIKTGTKEETSVQIAQRILNLNYDPQMGELNFLKSITMEELMQIKGIGRVKAIQIKAICELAIRMSKPSNFKKIQIKCTEQLANLVMEELRFEKREYVKLFLLYCQFFYVWLFMNYLESVLHIKNSRKCLIPSKKKHKMIRGTNAARIWNEQ